MSLPLPTGFSRDELLHEALVVPRLPFVPNPDTRVVSRPGWVQLITPTLKQGGLNEVSLAVLGDAEAEAVIDATVEEYRRLGVAFRWIVGPDSKPADLAERLARRGLTRTEVCAVARTTSDAGRVPPGIVVEPVDQGNVDDFTAAMAAGWDIDPAPLHALHQALLADPARRMRPFLARVDGQVVGTASYAATPRSAYLMGGVILPAFRGRGIYRALVAARLADAAASGLRLATSQAMADTSAPILAKLGFETICRFTTMRDPGKR